MNGGGTNEYRMGRHGIAEGGFYSPAGPAMKTPSIPGPPDMLKKSKTKSKGSAYKRALSRTK